MFHQIETRLKDFLDYVPLNFDLLNVYSLKLITTILEIGPGIIDSFDLAVFHCGRRRINEHLGDIQESREKLLEKEKKLRKKNKSLTFNDYYSFLDTHGSPRLNHATIRLRHLGAYIKPFERVHPEWWQSHNLLKHDKYNNLKKATLQNALKASSALFWLVDYNSFRRGYAIGEPFSSNLFIKVEPYEIDRERHPLRKL